MTPKNMILNLCPVFQEGVEWRNTKWEEKLSWRSLGESI